MVDQDAACRSLFLAVIHQALEDSRGKYDFSYPCGTEQNVARVQRSAVLYLTGDLGRQDCEFANIPHSAVLKTLKTEYFNKQNPEKRRYR